MQYHHRGSLNEQQREAVETIYGPLLVIAGAGSGKTRVVTCRIAHLLSQGIPASSILAVTFTNKAAAEMKERVMAMCQNDVLVCTFHSLGVRILRQSIELFGYNRSFTIYDEQDVEKLMKVCISEVFGDAKADAKQFISMISQAKNAMQSPEDFAEASIDKFFPVIYKKYQDKLKECNAVDFDDLLFMPVRLFREFPHVLEQYRRRWSFLMIDEYQDTNKAQHLLVNLLVGEHKNLCAVGDPDQSIYSWRGADIGNILDFESDFPGGKVIRLEQNYRSRSNILNAANKVISNNMGRYDKKLWSDRGPGEKIKIYTADTEKGEAEFIAEKIRYHHNARIPLKQMAVFYRTNAQSRALEDRLLLHRIPYVIVGGVSFYQRREIKDILAFLRLVQSDVDFVSFLRTINIPKRGLGDATVEKIRLGAVQEGRTLLEYCDMVVRDNSLRFPIRLSAKQKTALKSYLDIIKELREVGKACSLKELVQRTIEQTGYLEHLKGEPDTFQERKENLNALIAKASEWEESSVEPSLEAFLEELSLKSSLDEAESTADRVNLMTIHNGKGLEFEVVFLAGLEEDLFPHANSRGCDMALEEERRLCYVGMTRAKEFLYLCNVRLRSLWGATRAQRPSRFLRELPSEYVEKMFAGHSIPSYSRREKFYDDNFADEDTVAEPFSDELELTTTAFAIDDVVFHQEFGIGKVTDVYEGGAGLTYNIIFSKDNRARTLAAKYARLKKL